MNQRLLALFVLLCAVLSVIAAPVDSNILEARALKKTVAKPAAKPVAKPVVAAKPPVVAAKPPVVAAKPPVVAAKPPAVAAKPPVVAAKPPTVAAKPPVTAPPPASCPLPARSPARRFLDYLGLRLRSSSAPCPPTLTGSTSTTPTPTTPVDPASKAAAKAAKASAKAAKASAAASKASAKAAASASAAALKRPTTGVVSNPPTKAVQCTNLEGGLTAIPLASIEKAVQLAQAGPLVGGKKFPHAFDNREGVKVAAACAGKTLEEQAVGVDMSTFQNIPSVLSTPAFNQFRVLITTPDATGATTFCGVMTHGTSTEGKFDKDFAIFLIIYLIYSSSSSDSEGSSRASYSAITVSITVLVNTHLGAADIELQSLSVKGMSSAGNPLIASENKDDEREYQNRGRERTYNTGRAHEGGPG
ncbi:hypothetical protein GGX14DRAFT_403453 [Mycena pura]|uniref:Uncharacterized protein n=1 Tax=Mycena pura TaxID=153505 RepID=A0AAD6Y157_9AGAR|nr:hypothetical protein GGX14DRAFT_403453 [Mycena pura]